MKILVADDQIDSVRPPIENCFKGILEEETNLKFVDNVKQCLREVVEWHPDTLLLDLSFPESRFDETIKYIIPKVGPLVCTIILTGHEEKAAKGLWDRCLKAGAMNYIVKQTYFDLESRIFLLHAIQNSKTLFKYRDFSKICLD